MGNNAKKDPKKQELKKEEPKKQEATKAAEKPKFVNPVVSWTVLALVLAAVIIIGCIVCR